MSSAPSPTARSGPATAVGEDAPVTVASASEAFEIYFDLVWRNLKRLGVDAVSVEDAAQDVFLVVHRRLPEFEGRSRFTTWLIGIVLRVASDYRKKRPPPDPFDAEPVSRLADPERIVQQREAGERLHAVLGQLKEHEREILVLVELSELSVPEAAQALSIQVNTAYGRLRHARLSFEGTLLRMKSRDEHAQVRARIDDARPLLAKRSAE